MSNSFGGSTIGTNYRGNRAKQPGDLNFEFRDPTQYDSQNHQVGDWWIANLLATTGIINLWWLASLQGNSTSKGMLADWVLISSSNGTLLTLTASDATIATPVAGNITFPDSAFSVNVDSNIQSTASAGIFKVNLKPSINLPLTNSSGTQGSVYLNSVRFITNYLNNVSVGTGSGSLNATPMVGLFNSAFGTLVMPNFTDATQNGGFGNGALNGLTTGSNNQMFGYTAGFVISSGSNNIGIGSSTFNPGANNGLKTGSGNIAIGTTAGNAYLAAESNNILIGTNQTGTLGESNVTRIGLGGAGAAATKCFIGGIAGVTTTVADAVAVLVSSSTGQLGTVSSTIRVKENVKDMAEDSSPVMKLRPVTFNYINDTRQYRQYGLIAEEVNEIMPQLVVLDKEGLPQTVKYHDLPIMLLNEIQKLTKRIEELEKK